MLSKNQLRDVRSLHLKKFRETRKLFIAEGAKTVSEIIATRPSLIERIYTSTAFLKAHSESITKNNLAFSEVTEEELRTISLQSNPNQVLAVCRQPVNEQAAVNAANFSFYLDDIRDPGNFGTIIRLCDWFGARKLYCSDESCELYNPKVIQSSMGAFLRVQVTYGSLEEALRDSGLSRIYGTVLTGSDVYSEKLQPGLIVIGNEANGISETNMKTLTHQLTIPAHSGNGSESLNAAMATAIIASEFFRQLR